MAPPETCCLHQLKFVEVDEFPDDAPDFSDVLEGYAMRRCQAACTSRAGARVQVAVCAEDSEAARSRLADSVP